MVCASIETEIEKFVTHAGDFLIARWANLNPNNPSTITRAYLSFGNLCKSTKVVKKCHHWPRSLLRDKTCWTDFHFCNNRRDDEPKGNKRSRKFIHPINRGIIHTSMVIARQFFSALRTRERLHAGRRWSSDYLWYFYSHFSVSSSSFHSHSALFWIFYFVPFLKTL